MITAVDRENWITISKVAVPSEVYTTMAEIAGTSMLTGALELLLVEKFNVENINRRINENLKKTQTQKAERPLSGKKAMSTTACGCDLPPRVLVERARNQVACVSAACFQTKARTHSLAPVASLSTEE